MTARVAVYYAPECDDPLWHAGCVWLGRDPQTGAALPQPPIPGLDALTAAARHYGFHATLKPPMRVATDRDRLLEDAEKLAARITPFALPPLAVSNLSGFVALCETAPCPALQALADSCIEALDPHRAAPSEAELMQRRAGGLSAEQEAMLRRWGYPAAFATWQFHMTLSCRLDDAARMPLMAEAETWFAGALAQPREVRSICLFEAAQGGPFNLTARLPLRG